MIPLLDKGYETLSFSNLLFKIKGEESDNIFNDFKELIFDPEKSYYKKLNFLGEKHSFLSHPLRKSEKETMDGHIRTTYYFKQPSAQDCILAHFAINPANIRAFFKSVERFCESKYKTGAIRTLNYYNEQLIENIKNSSETIAEIYRTKINDFWDVYLRYRKAGHKYIALGMLILVSLLNTTVISFLPSIKRTIIIKEKPITDINLLANKKIAIRSAMSDELYLCHNITNEPMNGEDKTIIAKRILYTSHVTQIDLSNAVFEIEKVDKNLLLTPKDDPTYGGRMIGFLKKPLSWAVKFVLPFEQVAKTIHYLKKLNTYYIKATFNINGEKLTRYVSYVNWYKESRLLLIKEPTEGSGWYIDMKKNGKTVIIPYGTLQYNAMAWDIPNATQTTFGIPVWLFPQNFTEAQKFYFYEIVD